MPHVIDGFARQFIREKVRRLLYLGRCVGYDAEDIEQELLLNLVRRAENFDPARGRWTTFVRLVTNNHIATLVRKWRSQRTTDLAYCPVDDGNLDPSWTETVTRRSPLMLEPSLQQAWCRREDLQDTVSTLSGTDQALCAALSEVSKTSAAGLVGMSRSTAYIHIEQIRQIFESEQLREYL
ncbi:MAG: sigma-70 family RNA polymerase sigma factor [Planctomycetaceae bacterium]|nr:sigma-70 family RNA polymerase sigma factor [Planctomycetaceae bacterium]